MLDTTVKVSLAALVIPGLVAYRPAAVAAGVVAAWLFAVITASFWVRKRIGMRVWRRLHWFTYALFGLATVHGITAGTDTTQPWARALYLGALGAVIAATACAPRFPLHAAPSRKEIRDEHVPHLHRPPDARQRLRSVRRPRPGPLPPRAGRVSPRRVVAETDDPAALDAADACPMGAIEVEEEAQAA